MYDDHTLFAHYNPSTNVLEIVASAPPFGDEPKVMARLASLFGLYLCVALLAGCASAGQRFEQGLELEQSGQRAAAAQRYLQALKKDPGHRESRQRLTRLAPIVLNDHVEQAANDRRRGAATQGAEAIIAADNLIAATRASGVTLQVPADYAAARRDLFDLAIRQSMQDARLKNDAGRWQEALATYNRISRYQPTTQQVNTVNDARTDTLIRAAQSERANGNFNASLALVDQALGSAAPADHDELRQLRDWIVREGTQRVLFLPVYSQTSASAGKAGFVAAVNDALQRRHWRELPVLTEGITSTSSDPAARRIMRRHGSRRRAPDHARAVRLGRLVDADLVVVVSLQGLSQREQITAQETRPAKLKSGGKTRYQVRHGRIISQATARYEIISVAGTRADTAATVSANHSRKFTDATYEGDIRQLALRRTEQALFKPDKSGQRAAGTAHQLDQPLADTLAANIAKQVLSRLDSQ